MGALSAVSNGGTEPKWPTYLLWNVPENIRQAIADEANERELSLADTVRSIFCARYDLECERGPTPREPAVPSRNAHWTFRAQPEVLQAIRAEALEREISVRQVMLLTLAEHYEEAMR